MEKWIVLILAAVLLLSFTVNVPAFSAEGSVSGISSVSESEMRSKYSAGDHEEVAAVILHTNDVHAGYQDYIGYDGLALYKKELELQYDHVFLVDAGDAVQGAVIGTISKGTALITMMNRLEYDIAIPGNHEFDFGFDVLNDYSETLTCGYICANFCTPDGEPVFRPWQILEADDLKIGFVGAVTPETITSSKIKDVVNEVGEPMYDFLSDKTGDRLATALQQNIDDVRENGADIVILITHLGSDMKGDSIYSSNAIVGKLTGVDMVIDGHTHEVYNTTIPDKEGKPIPIAQAGEKLKKIGQLTIYKDGRLEENLIDLVPPASEIPSERVLRNGEEIYADPEMKAFLDDITASYEPVLEQKIGDLSLDLVVWDGEMDYCRAEENGLCELAADAYRVITGAQTAIINAGCVRNNLESGEVTYKDVLNTLPYYNEIVKASVSGQMILDALEFSISFLPIRRGGFLQVSGITYSVNTDIESGVRKDEDNRFLYVDGEYKVYDVKIDGRDLDPGSEYTLTTNMFIFTGGDGYTMFKEADILEMISLSENELLIKFIEENLGGVIPEEYAKPLGRIQWTTSLN